MLMSDMAVRDLEHRRETFFDSCRRAFLAIFGRSSNHRLPEQFEPIRAWSLRSVTPREGASNPPTRVSSESSVQAALGTPQPWRRHPQLRAPLPPSEPIAPCRRSARLEAERGMILARGGKFAEATEAFIVAASDPGIELTVLPGFWDLPRQGMASAVRAYEHTRRTRDAAALEARMRQTLRPRAVTPMPAGVNQHRVTASGD